MNKLTTHSAELEQLFRRLKGIEVVQNRVKGTSLKECILADMQKETLNEIQKKNKQIENLIHSANGKNGSNGATGIYHRFFHWLFA